MRKLLPLLLIMLCLVGCISKSKHIELQTICDSLRNENKHLVGYIDELENGEERLLNLIKNSYSQGKYILTDKYIAQLTEKHPESKEIIQINMLRTELSAKIEMELKVIEQARMDSIKLANINNLGMWEIKHYVDDFDKPTNVAYIWSSIDGIFSNSATNNSSLRVHFVIDTKSIRMRLYEYSRNNPVKGSEIIHFIIRDRNGKVHNLDASADDYGYIEFRNYSFNKELSDYKKFKSILLEGGKIEFKGEEDKYGSPSIYKFDIENADFLENAITKIELQNKNLPEL